MDKRGSFFADFFFVDVKDISNWIALALAIGLFWWSFKQIFG